MKLKNLGGKVSFLVPWSVILVTIFLLFNFMTKGQVQSAVTSAIPKEDTHSLKEAVDNALEGSTGNYGILIKNLKTGESYSQNEHTSFASGSLYKIWVMAEAYNQIKNGDLKETDVLSENVGYLNNQFYINEENAELTEGSITLTVSDAIKQMITISHNYAALLLTEKLKLSNVAKFLSNNDFKESKVGTNGEDPMTTASDVAKFFEKLYRGKLAEVEYTDKMTNFLKGQQLNNKLPKNLPAGTLIAHKTGEINSYSHDAGIIYSPKGDYIIVVLSQSDNPVGAEGRIADISENVYNYFN